MTRDEEINLIADCAVPDDKHIEFKDDIVWDASHTRDGLAVRPLRMVED